MGLPVLTLISPVDTSSLTSNIIHFDMKYEDIINSYSTTSFVFEFDTVNTFNSANLITKSYSIITTGTTVRTIINLIDNTWYWRVTAINSSGTTVSNIYSLIVLKTFKRVLYQYENIGKVVTWTNKRVLYQYENIISYVIEGQWLRTRNIRIKRRLQ